MEKLIMAIPMDVLLFGAVTIVTVFIALYELKKAIKATKRGPFKDKFDGYL